MSVPLLEAIADAIMAYEGWCAGSRSNRNRNPGNLRPYMPEQKSDPDGYRIFASLTDGYEALIRQLYAYTTGRNAHDLNEESTLLDLFEVYAPSGDHNAPVRYADFVARWLQEVYGSSAIVGATKIRHIFEIVHQELPHGITAA